MTNIIKGGQIIRKSKNLRGMLEYARLSPVVRIEACDIGPFEDANQRLRSQGTMLVLYRDGATCRANFESYRVMLAWVRKRRSWRGAMLSARDNDNGMGFVQKLGA